MFNSIEKAREAVKITDFDDAQDLFKLLDALDNIESEVCDTLEEITTNLDAYRMLLPECGDGTYVHVGDIVWCGETIHGEDITYKVIMVAPDCYWIQHTNVLTSEITDLYIRPLELGSDKWVKYQKTEEFIQQQLADFYSSIFEAFVDAYEKNRPLTDDDADAFQTRFEKNLVHYAHKIYETFTT